MNGLILVAIVLGLGFLLHQLKPSLFARKQKEPAVSNQNLKIQNVQPGGVVQLKGAGPEMEDLDVVISKRHRYEEGGFEWMELEGDSGSKKIWIEVEEDDGLSIAVTFEKLKLRDLNIGEEDLRRMERDDQGEIQYRRKSYFYEESGQAVYYAKGQGSGEPYTYWDFEDDEGEHFIGVEKWGPNEFEVCKSESLRPAQVEVFGLTGNG